MDHRWLDVDDQNPFMESIIYNTQDFPLDDGSRSPPHEEPDLLEDRATYRPNSVGDWGIGQYVGESFEGLELNRDSGLSNYEMSDSTFGMTNNTGMDTDPSQFIPETINSMLNPESTNNRTCEFHPRFSSMSLSFLTRAQIERPTSLILPKV